MVRRFGLVSVCVLVLLAAAVNRITADYFSLPFIDCTQHIESHYELGVCMGVGTADQIESRWSQDTTFQNLYAWIHTPSGQAIYQQFVDNNQRQFPLYFDEMHGTANGANVDVNKIVVATLADELNYFYHQQRLREHSSGRKNKNRKDKHDNHNVHDLDLGLDLGMGMGMGLGLGLNSAKLRSDLLAPKKPVKLSCSDYLLQEYAGANDGQIVKSYMAHNEDNGPVNRNNTFLVHAKIKDQNDFFCYAYAAELLSQAVCWNAHIVFTSNFVGPADAVVGGYGRNFIARQMIDQTTTMDEVMAISAQDGQCQGHNYQIAQWADGNSSDAEVAYDALHVFTLVDQQANDGWLFHANEYIHLNISQNASPSSESREDTAKLFGKPKDLDEMLDNLGTKVNKTYPIYLSGEHNDYTQHTFGVDVVAGAVTIYADNPQLRNAVFQWSLH